MVKAVSTDRSNSHATEQALGRIQGRFADLSGRTQAELAELVSLAFDEGDVIAGVKTSSHERFLRQRFGSALHEAAVAELGDDAQVHWRTRPDAFPSEPKTAHDPSAHQPADRSGSQLAPHAHDLAADAVRHARTQRRDGARSRPSWRYAFDDFVVGECNRMAYATAQRVATEQNSGGLHTLFVHGPCGVGKTHLLHGLAREYWAHHPGAKVKCVTGEAFANEFIACVRGGDIRSFRQRFRDLDLLCVDDIHFLGEGDKTKTQAEFLHTFEALELSGATVVLASDEHPSQITSLRQGLVSRCMSGAMVRIDRPDYATRLAIAERLLTARRLTPEQSGLEAIARAATGSVRDLRGLVDRVEAFCRLLGGGDVVTSGLVCRVIGECGGFAPPRAVRPDHVLAIVSARFGVDPSDVLGRGRHARVVLARSVASWLLKQMTTMSYPEIARSLKRSTHTTVLAACKRIEHARTEDKPVECDGPLGGAPMRIVLERLRDEINSNTEFATLG